MSQAPPIEGGDDGTGEGYEAESIILASFCLWREAHDRGEPADREKFAAGLSDEQGFIFDRLINRHLMDRRLHAALGQATQSDKHGLDIEPMGVAGRYGDLRKHSKGGMGVVYRARDVKLDRDVAYKVINSAYGNEEEFRQTFEREAKITARLQYPGIVAIYGLERDDSGPLAYAMQFVDGDNLYAILKADGARGVLGGRDRLAQFLTACRVVAYAHREHYIHGDLSPKNLMIDRSDAAFVVDWGLAQYVGQHRPGVEVQAPSPRLGGPATAGYVAPSIVAGGARSSITDVYSLGAILAAVVLGLNEAGRPNIDGGRLEVVHRPLRAIIEGATAGNRNPPYADAGGLADDLARYLAGDGVWVDREPLREKVWRSVRHHPTRATALVSSVLLLLLAVTSASLVSAARARARERDEVASKDAEEALSSRREAMWSQANAAILRSGVILERNPTPQLLTSPKVDQFLDILARLVSDSGMVLEMREALRLEREQTIYERKKAEAVDRREAESELREVIAILDRLDSEILDRMALPEAAADKPQTSATG